ncbi:MAG: hypothetical protein QNJ68_23695 [Microcoleaceae cyanobacterium MO_207.B10]|nr:hypothetical protein [Microcoleaceae cyanobacterium MO_207.B10]
MILIREVVQEALTTGSLTVVAEDKLSVIFSNRNYDLEDMNALMSLQLATMAGHVKQESQALN